MPFCMMCSFYVKSAVVRDRKGDLYYYIQLSSACFVMYVLFVVTPFAALFIFIKSKLNNIETDISDKIMAANAVKFITILVVVFCVDPLWQLMILIGLGFIAAFCVSNWAIVLVWYVMSIRWD